MIRKLCFSAFLFFVILLVGALPLYAQADSAESTVLPDVTTVIQGEDLQVDDDAVPDFSGALPPDVSVTNSLPVLPELSADEDGTANSDFARENDTARNVFMEGSVAFGWPYLFAGDFSVYRIHPDSFLLHFLHDSVGGYGFRGQDSGFFDSRTELTAEKEFSREKIFWKLNGNYAAEDIGLQGNSALFDDVNFRLLSGGALFAVPFGKGFSVSTQVAGKWFSRYAAFADSLRSIPDSDSVALSFIQLNPEASFSWQNDLISLSLQGFWNSDFFLSSDVPHAGRGGFSFDGQLFSSNLELGVSAGVVFLPGGAGLESKSVLIPFSLGVEGNIPLASSSSAVKLRLEGGLSTDAVNYAGLNLANPFTDFTPELLSQNREQTDWYASLSADIPLHSRLSASLSADFRKTAFGNGVLCSDFSAMDGITGFFPVEIIERTQLGTELGFVVSVKDVMLSAKWKAHWVDVLPGQAQHSVMAAASYMAKNWGAELSLGEYIGANQDKMPDVQASVYYRPANAVKLELCLRDAIKLFSGTSRVFAEPYVARSGTASFSVHFMY